MSASRWLIPIVMLACLFGFALGYVLLPLLPPPPIASCMSCDKTGKAAWENKFQKQRSDYENVKPAVLTEVTVIKRGDPFPLPILTIPGAICAVSVFYDAGTSVYSGPTIFAGQDGRCEVHLNLPSVS